MAPYAFIDFVDYISVEHGFYENWDCSQEDTSSKERCSLSKPSSKGVTDSKIRNALYRQTQEESNAINIGPTP